MRWSPKYTFDLKLGWGNMKIKLIPVMNIRVAFWGKRIWLWHWSLQALSTTTRDGNCLQQWKYRVLIIVPEIPSIRFRVENSEVLLKLDNIISFNAFILCHVSIWKHDKCEHWSAGVGQLRRVRNMKYRKELKNRKGKSLQETSGNFLMNRYCILGSLETFDPVLMLRLFGFKLFINSQQL